jgi:hypothetical protein
MDSRKRKLEKEEEQDNLGDVIDLSNYDSDDEKTVELTTQDIDVYRNKESSNQVQKRQKVEQPNFKKSKELYEKLKTQYQEAILKKFNNSKDLEMVEEYCINELVDSKLRSIFKEIEQRKLTQEEGENLLNQENTIERLSEPPKLFIKVLELIKDKYIQGFCAGIFKYNRQHADINSLNSNLSGAVMQRVINIKHYNNPRLEIIEEIRKFGGPINFFRNIKYAPNEDLFRQFKEYITELTNYRASLVASLRALLPNVSQNEIVLKTYIFICDALPILRQLGAQNKSFKTILEEHFTAQMLVDLYFDGTTLNHPSSSNAEQDTNRIFGEEFLELLSREMYIRSSTPIPELFSIPNITLNENRSISSEELQNVVKIINEKLEKFKPIILLTISNFIKTQCSEDLKNTLQNLKYLQQHLANSFIYIKKSLFSLYRMKKVIYLSPKTILFLAKKGQEEFIRREEEKKSNRVLNDVNNILWPQLPVTNPQQVPQTLNPGGNLVINTPIPPRPVFPTQESFLPNQNLPINPSIPGPISAPRPYWLPLEVTTSIQGVNVDNNNNLADGFASQAMQRKESKGDNAPEEKFNLFEAIKGLFNYWLPLEVTTLTTQGANVNNNNNHANSVSDSSSSSHPANNNKLADGFASQAMQETFKVREQEKESKASNAIEIKLKDLELYNDLPEFIKGLFKYIFVGAQTILDKDTAYHNLKNEIEKFDWSKWLVKEDNKTSPLSSWQYENEMKEPMELARAKDNEQKSLFEFIYEKSFDLCQYINKVITQQQSFIESLHSKSDLIYFGNDLNKYLPEQNLEYIDQYLMSD